MANNKLYGYTPKTSNEKDGNRLDNYNPYEFRKGMDYELTSMGCMRLAESTPDEREKATESVLKNLDHHPAYYSGLIQFEAGMNHAGVIEGKNFKSWLKDHFDINKMQEIKNAFKFDKMEDADFKGDKMEELKEAIKKEIRGALNEAGAKAAAMADMEDEGEIEGGKKDKGKSKKDKPVRKDRFDKEEEAIKDLLFRVDHKLKENDVLKGALYCKEEEDSNKEADDHTMDDPNKGSLLYVKDCLMKKYNEIKADSGGDIKAAKEAYDGLQKAANLAFEDVFKDFEEEFEKNEIGDLYKKENMLFQTIKNLQERLKLGLNKARAGVEEEAREIRRQVAETEMTRTEALRLLEIIKEQGISLREGSGMVKPYYEIAKAAYLEGVANALKL
jgi:hypothetical protein